MKMRGGASASGLLLLLAALAAAPPVGAAAVAGAIDIEAKPPGCLLRGRPAELVACVTAPRGLARARLYFRARGSRPWYWVDMSTQTGCSLGVLPPTRPETAGVEYYVEATDRTFDASRTDQLELKVAGTAAACPAGTTPAPAAVGSGMVVSGPAGAPETPDGFLGGRAVMTAASAPVKTEPASAPVAAAPGHSSRWPLVVGGALVAGGGVAVAASAHHGHDVAPAAPAGMTVTFSPPGVALAGATVINFAATSSGNSVSYAWAFGDGAMATGPTVSHTYKSDGHYAVILTATNAGGSAAAATTVDARTLTGSWAYSLSNGFASELDLIQVGGIVSGPGDGFALNGTVSNPRALTFVNDGNGCHEPGRVVADPTLDLLQGTLDSCEGPIMTVIMRRQ